MAGLQGASFSGEKHHVYTREREKKIIRFLTVPLTYIDDQIRADRQNSLFPLLVLPHRFEYDFTAADAMPLFKWELS